MGNCCSSPETQGDGKLSSGGVSKKLRREKTHHGAPVDAGLDGSHQAVKLIGHGAAGQIWLFRDLKRRELVAVKLFPLPLDPNNVNSVIREVQIAAEVAEDDVNLISVHEAILTPSHLALVMEYAEGGSLVQHVAERWQYAEQHGLVLSEDETRYLFRQFIKAVAYCHQHGIAHRDLKLDNTLLHSQPPILKICDFGFATSFKQRLERMTSHIGTPEYMSPELLHNNKEEARKPYDPRTVDVWASGVMMVVALLGAFPFDPSRQHHTDLHDAEVDLWLQEVSQSWSDSPYIADNVDKLSPECRDLLDRIFTVDAQKRITVEEIMQHPWYNKPLLPHYAEAFEKMQRAQDELNRKHAAAPLDYDLVDRRNEAIRMLVAKATRKGDDRTVGRAHHMRPLHMLDVKGQSLESVNLRREAVVRGADKEAVTTLPIPEGPLGPHPIPGSTNNLATVAEGANGESEPMAAASATPFAQPQAQAVAQPAGYEMGMGQAGTRI